METLLQDTRYAWRTLGSHKGFAVVVVLSLALGIGVNSAVFSLVDTMLLRLLPVRHPEELVLLQWRSGLQAPAAAISGETDFDDAGISSTSFSYPAFERLRQRSRAVSDLFAFSDLDRLSVSTGAQAEIVHGQLVSGGYFAALGAPAAAGRLLNAADDRPDAPPAAVISYGLWRRFFALDPAAVGQTLTLDGTPFVVVGVTPPGFRGALELSRPPDVSVPLARQAEVRAAGPLASSSLMADPNTWWLVVMGRLRRGFTREQARAELEVAFRQSYFAAAAPPREGTGRPSQAPPRLRVLPGGRGLTEDSRDLAEPLLLMMGLVGLVLLVACANVAGLLLSRAAARRRELGMRVALGASRGRLVRQLLTESVMLALIGGSLGLFLTTWSADLLLGLLPASAARQLDAAGVAELGVTPNARLVAFTAAVALLTGLLFGLAPALRATRLDPLLAIQGAAADGRERRFRLGQMLVVAQVALALMLVIGAGLLVRSLRNLARLDLGFNREGVLVFSIDPTLNGYHGARLADFYARLQQRLERLPGATSASLSAYILLSGSSSIGDLFIEGYRQPAGEKSRMLALEHPVGPTFFKTMQIPILLGRGLTPRDDENAPKVAVISASLARKYFPAGSPLGRRIGRSAGKLDREIVGVAADARFARLREENPMTVFTPYLQQRQLGRLSCEVRTRSGNPAALLPAVRRAVQDLDPNLPLYDVNTQAAQVEAAMRQERLLAELSSCFGLLCLLLAAVGLYGIISFAVSRRTRETGIRIALGARPAELVWQVLRKALLLLAAGLALGLAAALAAKRLVDSLLFGLAATDPATMASAILLLLAVGALAAWLPARRAALVDPVEALRRE